MRLRVASYNIHAGVGDDNFFRPQRTAELLDSLEADVIGLQEVISLGPDGFAFFAELAKTTEMTSIPGGAMLRGDAEYGNALVIRLPASNVRKIELPFNGREPRGALNATLETRLGRSAPNTVPTRRVGASNQHSCSGGSSGCDWSRRSGGVTHPPALPRRVRARRGSAGRCVTPPERCYEG